MAEKIKLTNAQMNVMLVAVEHGYKQCEKGANLEAALASVYDLYEVGKPPGTHPNPIIDAAERAVLGLD